MKFFAKICYLYCVEQALFQTEVEEEDLDYQWQKMELLGEILKEDSKGDQKSLVEEDQ